MPGSHGYRARTRQIFAKGFRKHGATAMSTVLNTYRLGELVDVVVDGAVHKGMPHKLYHGRTGRVFNVNPNSIGVIINKEVRNRIEQKRIHVRVEHIRKSTCQTEFKERVRKAEQEKRDKKPKQIRKRMPGAPKSEFVVKTGKSTQFVFQNPELHKEIF